MFAVRIEKMIPPVQFAQVSVGLGGVPLDHLADLKVAALFPVAGFQHGERTGEPDPVAALPVETVHEQDMSSSNGQPFRARPKAGRPPPGE